jgi:hypothetical protein
MPRGQEIDGFSQFGLQKLHTLFWGCVWWKIVLPTHRRIALAVEDSVFFRFRAEDQTWYRSNGFSGLAR